MIDNILSILPLIVAPAIMIIWSLISAYVFRLGLRGSGIGFDYVVFTVIVVLALLAGGAI